MKKVLFVIAHEGFRPEEYYEPKKILMAAGVEFVTASNAAGMATPKFGDELAKVDLVLDDVKTDDYNGIFFVGGPGALEHLDNEKSYRIIKEAAEKGKVFGAICISPRILARAGVLKNKKATGWNKDNELGKILADAGANYIKESVVVDGKLVTASGPSAAQEFGKKILDKLS
ncbi:DJ-1/PfpI family protein [Patescibacteria group bacterium]|nr:MAG: DJ-1/PfpI family protein [Patescibacteria group bacterium]